MMASLVFALLFAVQTETPFPSRRPELRDQLLEKGGGSIQTEAAVRKALGWLAKSQKSDGSWEAPEKEYGICVTGLALLAFLGASHSPDSKEYRQIIQRGLHFLIAAQDKEGCIGERGPKYMYGHAIATACLAEATGMSEAKTYRLPAQRAVDFVVAAQNPRQGWRYSSRCDDSDALVTVWSLLALCSAEQVRLPFPRTAYDDALSFLSCLARDNGSYGYKFRASSEEGLLFLSVQPFELHPTTTAAALFGQFLINGRKDAPRTLSSLEILLKDKPREEKNSVDFYYWHLASLAIHSLTEPSSETWKVWNTALKDVLLPSQETQGNNVGSWDPVDCWSYSGGRAYATAMNALTLETYYRYDYAKTFPKK